MKSDIIAEIAITPDKRLAVKPQTEALPYIYREAAGVYWDNEHKWLYSQPPRDWTYGDWFQHIVDTAKLQSLDLQVNDTTQWSHVPDELKSEIQSWCANRKKDA